MTQVEIVPLEAEHLPGLLALVAGHLRMARYPFDATTEVLRQRAALALGSDGLFVERRRWMVSAAVDNGRLVGAVRAYAVDRDAAGLKAEQDRVPADIGWLLFEPDQPAAGAALLGAALSWIGDDPEGVEAFELGHGMGWCGGVPDTWLHVNAIVGRAGFEWRETSYLMWGSGPPAVSGDVNPEVQVTLDVTSDGAWQFWAQLDRVKVGELLVKRMDAPTGWQPTWSGGRWIDWVHVEEPLRRRGIAAAMFAALAERARRSGVRRLAASTRDAAATRLNERIGMTNRLALRRYVFPSGEPKNK
jgi:GNAT superfamily N-acetyltransferase